MEKFLEKRFSNVKLISLNNEQDAQRFIMKLNQQKLLEPIEKRLRPFVFVQSISYQNLNVRKIIKKQKQIKSNRFVDIFFLFF